MSLMSWQKSIRVLLVICVLLVSVTAKTQKMRRITTGVWGGEHIRMKVGAKSATIEYDCASGVIDGTLVVDRDGEFNLHGKQKMERGGPVRLGQEPKKLPASYTGRIKDHTLGLTLN